MTSIDNKTFLVAVSEYGEFDSLMPLSKEIVKRLNLHPVFVFPVGYGLLYEHGRLIELEGWSWVQLGTKNLSFQTVLDVSSNNGYFPVAQISIDTKPISFVTKHSIGLGSILWGYVFFLLLSIVKVGARKLEKKSSPLKNILLTINGLKKLLIHSEYIFQLLRPCLILSGQDYALSVTSFLSKVGEKYGVKTAIVPFSMPPTTKEIIETFAYHSYNKLVGIEMELAKKYIPHWLNQNRGHVYSRVSPFAAIVSDHLGLTPTQPWVPNSGRGVIFVPSRWAQEYYLMAGIPSSQLRLTGALWSDKLIQSARTRPMRKERLMANIEALAPVDLLSRGLADKLAILSWAPNQYPRKALGCPTYEDLCNQFMTAAQELQNAGIVRVAVSMHPTLTDEKLLSALHKANIFVLRTSLIEYVDCADVFISTVSSTNFWALQCGIPTINFDGYLYGYTEFDEAGAITVKTPFEVFSVCKRLFEDELYFGEITTRIADSSPRFFEKEGDNLERIMNTMIDLLSLKNAEKFQ